MDALNHIGYQQLTVTAAVVGLALPAGLRPTRALIICGPVGAAATNYVRWRADGVNPTATVGMPLPVGAALDMTFEEDLNSFGMLTKLKFFLGSGAVADALLEIAYFD